MLLLAPVWMQIGHLPLADPLWIAAFLLTARRLGRAPELLGQLPERLG